MRIVLVLALAASCVSAQTAKTADPLHEAVAAHGRGDLARAASLYRQVLKSRPDLLQARLNLGAALAEMGKLDEAIEVLAAAPPPGRQAPALRKNLALAYYRKQDFAAAVRELETLSPAHLSDAELSILLADSALRSGDPKKAATVAQKALAAHPRDTKLLYLLGTALVRSGRPAEALDPLEQAGKLGSSPEAYLLAGATALDAGQFQRAREDVEAALRIDPSIPGAWTWAGLARDRVSDEEGAKTAFRKALEIDPNDFESTFHLGAILYREREMEQARPYLDRALHLQPSSSLARYALALVRSAMGEHEKAVADLEELVRTNPNWVEPHVKLASLYFRLRRPADGERERAIIEKLKSEGREEKLSVPALEPQ